MMDKDTRGAFTAWCQAIGERLRDEHPGEFIGEVARAYGARITTEEAITEVAKWFDWEVIERAIKGESK